METIKETSTIIEKKPSLLRQIVDEVDMLDEEGKVKILRKIKMEKSLKLAKEIDEELKNCERLVAEEDIADLVSNYRKEKYFSNQMVKK